MLGIGIDWAEEFHDVAFGTPEEGVVEQFRIEHGPAGCIVSRIARGHTFHRRARIAVACAAALRLPQRFASKSHNAQSSAFLAAPGASSCCSLFRSKSLTRRIDSICAKTESAL